MFSIFREPNRMEDLALLTRHLAGTIAARAPLAEVLKAYTHEAEPGAVRKAVGTLAERVESGVELSEAMEEFPKLFPAPYRRLIRMGEQGHSLGAVMGRLAETLEDNLKTYEFIRRASVYPLVVLVILFFNVAFFEYKLLPKFVAIFQQMGVPRRGTYALEPSNAAFVRIDAIATNFLGDHWLSFSVMLLLLLPIGLTIAASMGLRLRPFGYGRFALQLPLVGGVLRRAETARFAGNLALLLEHRVPLAEALGLLSESTENTYVQAALRDFQARFEEGELLGAIIETQPLFPPGMAVLIAAAEDQGRLPDTLRALSTFYNERTAHGVAVMREFLEPLMLFGVALLVGIALMAMYSPLFAFPRYVY